MTKFFITIVFLLILNLNNNNCIIQSSKAVSENASFITFNFFSILFQDGTSFSAITLKYGNQHDNQQRAKLFKTGNGMA